MNFDETLKQYQQARHETRGLRGELARARLELEQQKKNVAEKERELACARKRLAAAREPLHSALTKEISADLGAEPAEEETPAEEPGREDNAD